MSDPLVIYVLNGPNLNLLGDREPEIYGYETLADIDRMCAEAGEDAEVVCRQTNHEGTLVDWVQEARKRADALVINPGGYGHTSIALLDSLRALTIPIVECHLSNVAARETYRRHSYVSPVVTGYIAGFGATSYRLAVQCALTLARERAAPKAR